MKHAIATLMVLCIGTTVAAESPQQSFVKAWKGQPVVVKATLYSLVYNERGKLGTTRSGQREGVVVVTSSSGGHFQFDGRHGRDTVIAQNAAVLMNAVSTEYEPDAIEVRGYRKLEPLAIERFEPGYELVVSDVRIERDEVKLAFAQPGGVKDTMTSLRIKWPLPLSPSFSERLLVEDMLRRFVDVK